MHVKIWTKTTADQRLRQHIELGNVVDGRKIVVRGKNWTHNLPLLASSHGSRHISRALRMVSESARPDLSAAPTALMNALKVSLGAMLVELHSQCWR